MKHYNRFTLWFRYETLQLIYVTISILNILSIHLRYIRTAFGSVLQGETVESHQVSTDSKNLYTRSCQWRVSCLIVFTSDVTHVINDVKEHRQVQSDKHRSYACKLVKIPGTVFKLSVGSVSFKQNITHTHRLCDPYAYVSTPAYVTIVT
jgi:hypothetical protein